MLVFTRRVGEEIVIDGKIRITILRTKGKRVRVGITAPESVRVDREEIHQRRADFVAGPSGQGSFAVAGRVAKSFGRAALPGLIAFANGRAPRLAPDSPECRQIAGPQALKQEGRNTW